MIVYSKKNLCEKIYTISKYFLNVDLMMNDSIIIGYIME